MGDRRHKRAYPEGEAREMTPEWKALVRRRLAENKAADVFPRDQVELARAIGLGKNGKTAITKMFQAQTSKLVDPICDVLKIHRPTIVATGDDLEKEISSWAQDKRAEALKLLKRLGY